MTDVRILSKTIDECNLDGRAALIGYLTAGFPDIERSCEAAVQMVKSGCDVVEVGIPYSDPGMDGPIIQATSFASIHRGFKTEQVFEVTKAIAQAGASAVVMSYYNPIIQYGLEEFAAAIKTGGGSATIIPDLPPEEAESWMLASKRQGLEQVFLAAPASYDHRLKQIVDLSNGFVYAASRMGVTGLQSSIHAGAHDLVDRLRRFGAKRVCVGIGVSNSQQAHEVAQYADGVIVGSALLSSISDESITWGERLNTLAAIVKDIRAGVDRK